MNGPVLLLKLLSNLFFHSSNVLASFKALLISHELYPTEGQKPNIRLTVMAIRGRFHNLLGLFHMYIYYYLKHSLVDYVNQMDYLLW